MRLLSLALTQFRNLERVQLVVPETANVVALIGPNGAGKTSVLEGISMFAGGRGLESADLKEQGRNGTKTWGVYGEILRQNDAPLTLAMGVSAGKKQVKIDGAVAEPGSLLRTTAMHGGIVWLTPRQDRLFYGPPAERRDVLDDWAAWVIENHEEAVARYKTHTQNRLRLLREGRLQGEWLDAEEAQAAKWGIQLLRGRRNYLSALAPHLTDVELTLGGTAQEVLDGPDPVEALQGKFFRSREIDARLERTHAGPNTADVVGVLKLEDHGVQLHLASSGQHKRAVAAWLLAQVRLMHQLRGTAPLVLLDEAGAHLDATRRTALLLELATLGCQVWLTDVEAPVGLSAAHVISMPIPA